MPDVVKFEITISSDTAQGHDVQEQILKVLEESQFPDKDLFGVKLALEEAIVNAIKHGNGMDPSKSVFISCSVENQLATIVIQDEGPGFDPGDVPDPTDDDNLEKPSGRGLMLMKAFMTNISYNESGNRVEMTKQRSEDD